MFRAHFRSGLVSRGQLQIIIVDSRHCREAPGNYEVKLGNCGDIGTGTKSKWYRYPSVVGEPVKFWYRYHTNLYRYRNAIFAGFKRNFDLGVRARLSFDSHFEITNVDCI